MHIQDFRAGDFVHRVVETGVLGRCMGVAGYPQQHLGIFRQQLVELFGRLGVIPGRIQFAAGDQGAGDGGVAENQGGFLPVVLQFLFQPGQLFLGQLHGIFAFQGVRGQEYQEVLAQLPGMVQGAECLLVGLEVEPPFIRIRRYQPAGAGQIPVIDDFMVPGQEFLGLFHPVRQFPGQFVVSRAAGFLDHIPGKDAQVHILPAVDVPDGCFFVCDFPGPEFRFPGFAAVMDVTAHHNPFIAPGLDRLVQRQEGQHTGRQGAQGREKQLFFVLHKETTPFLWNPL